MRDRTTANELCYKCDCRRSDFAMIDDMALLKQAMERMDAEDPTVAQAAKDARRANPQRCQAELFENG